MEGGNGRQHAQPAAALRGRNTRITHPSGQGQQEQRRASRAGKQTRVQPEHDDRRYGRADGKLPAMKSASPTLRTMPQSKPLCPGPQRQRALPAYAAAALLVRCRMADDADQQRCGESGRHQAIAQAEHCRGEEHARRHLPGRAQQSAKALMAGVATGRPAVPAAGRNPISSATARRAARAAGRKELRTPQPAYSAGSSTTHQDIGPAPQGGIRPPMSARTEGTPASSALAPSLVGPAQVRCCARCLFISNIVTLDLPKILPSVSSARISRRLSGFWRFLDLM